MTLHIDSFSLICPKGDYLIFFFFNFGKRSKFYTCVLWKPGICLQLGHCKILKINLFGCLSPNSRMSGTILSSFFLVLSQFEKQIYIYSKVRWHYYLFWHTCLCNCFIVNKNIQTFLWVSAVKRMETIGFVKTFFKNFYSKSL